APSPAVRPRAPVPVLSGASARGPLGHHVARHTSGAAVIVPGRRFPEYLAVMCGLIRRYGAAEPTVDDALLRLLLTCADVAGNDPEIAAAVDEQARIILADAEREVRQPADLSSAQARAESVFQAVLRHPPSQSAGQ